METPKGIQGILNQVMVAPSLALARQLEQKLVGHGYRKMVFGRINQKASIEAASEGDRGAVERLANAFDASLTAARVASGAGASKSSLTPRKAAQRFLNPNPDSCDWKPQYPKIDFEMPIIQFWREDETKRRFKRFHSGSGLCSLLVRDTSLGIGRKEMPETILALNSESKLRTWEATIRYTNPTLQRFFAGTRNEQLEIELQAPNQVWVGDITYLKVAGIYRYLAVVMDKYSRRIVGWAYGKRKDVALTLKALNRAVRYRRPLRGLIFHTDRGIEYAAGAFKERLLELGITPSMNRPGKINDNAYIESFFHSMKSEIVHGLTFTEDREIVQAVRAYVPFYNDTRLHSSLNYVPPATYEQLANPGVN